MGRKIKVRYTHYGRTCLTCGKYKMRNNFHKDPTGFKGYKAHCIECYNAKRQNKEELKKIKQQEKQYYEKNKEVYKMRQKFRRLLEKDEKFVRSMNTFKQLGEWTREFAVDYKVNYLMNIFNIPLEEIKKAYKRFNIDKGIIDREPKSKRTKSKR